MFKLIMDGKKNWMDYMGPYRTSEAIAACCLFHCLVLAKDLEIWDDSTDTESFIYVEKIAIPQ